MMSNSQKQIIEECFKKLGEHFDNVHIFISSNESASQGTFYSERYQGNFFARYGQIKHWTIKEEAKTKKDVADSE